MDIQSAAREGQVIGPPLPIHRPKNRSYPASVTKMGWCTILLENEAVNLRYYL
jgi:hypothetical protein